MKKAFLALLLATFMVQAARACDICGSVSRLNPYLFPHLSKSFISLTYLRTAYCLHENSSTTRLTSNTILLSAQHTIAGKIQFTALLPYQINQSEAGSITSNFQGLGDATVLANYNVVQTGKAGIQHHLSIGGGVKMATGQYKADKSTPLNNINFQLGTGSFDYLMNATYRLSTGNIALSTLSAYRYNTPNKGRYRYGDVWIMGGTAIYVVHQKDLSLAPYVQLLNEKHYRDAANHILQNHSGGSILYTGGGLDISTTKLTLGINYQIAAKQNLVQGEMTAKPRLSARLSFTL